MSTRVRRWGDAPLRYLLLACWSEALGNRGGWTVSRPVPIVNMAFGWPERFVLTSAMPPRPRASAEAPSDDPAPSAGGFSQSLERGLAILSSFSENRPLLGIAEL